MENKTNIELTDLKQAFDHADETSDGAIKSHTVINILNDLGIEDISEEQIKKGLQQIKSNYGQNEETEQQILYNAGNELDIMKKRLDLNYGLDTVQNNKIMNENPELFKGAQFSQDLWNWVNELKGDPDDEHEIPFRNFNEKSSQQQGLSQEFDIFSENPNFSLLDQDDHQKILMMLQNFLSFIKKLCKDAQFEQPFVRCICQFISNDNYQEILEEKNIPVLDKICYALRFADFQSLNDFLDKQINESINKGLLDGLIYLGSQDERAVQIVQNYINQTNDIQTAALISQYLLFFNFTNKQKLHNFYQCYKDLLNKLELYEERFSLERSVQNLEKQFPQYKRLDNLQEQIDKSAIHQVCKKCSYVLTHKNILKQLSRGQMKYNFNLLNGSDSQKINQCPSCNAKLHLCNICRLPLQIANPSFYFTQMKKQNKTDQNDITNNLDDAIVWCQQCDHGGHFNHIYEWFSEYSHCPVSDCNCQCSIL
ncbi:hypothetical protein PPERSA_06532 [Pseudocohnilembus persalinus]|uniref:EF-hand domain-containing protein n=1 Tax=Pseudocohnilembus persalinus TaxID=266149 RepID=A0A0V0QRF6_PSEPJ|nr:hypothetical protein PPERSA_06532 [Pseudocohnilembus persalinus]|eukprot:KRX04898.1 hypothetical protein PPERSA_06532 [Pseudocohnilembus persalinus]